MRGIDRQRLGSLQFLRPRHLWIPDETGGTGIPPLAPAVLNRHRMYPPTELPDECGHTRANDCEPFTIELVENVLRAGDGIKFACWSFENRLYDSGFQTVGFGEAAETLPQGSGYAERFNGRPQIALQVLRDCANEVIAERRCPIEEAEA